MGDGLVSPGRGPAQGGRVHTGHAVSDAEFCVWVKRLAARRSFNRTDCRADCPLFRAAPGCALCSWVSLPDPHEPWMAPRQYTSMFPRDQIELPPQRADEFSDGTAPERNRVLHNILSWRDDDIDDVYGVMGAYYGMVRFLDDGLGQILDAQERLQLRENTIVVFCSDHGDFMGEHGMTCKGGVFYDCLTRVPLIVSWPGQVSSGLRDESMVNLIDVVPTLLELQGLDTPRAMQGTCLPTVTGAAPRDATFSEYGSGGPAFTQEDLNRLPRPWGRSALMRSCSGAKRRAGERWCAPNRGNTSTTRRETETNSTICAPIPGNYTTSSTWQITRPCWQICGCDWPTGALKPKGVSPCHYPKTNTTGWIELWTIQSL